MEIFCMDIVLYESTRARFGGTHFLVHDSHLFDGVDARQISAALQIGRASVGTSGQYIVTMNSDIFETLPLRTSFESEGAVLEVRLSEETEESGLFGFRFA